MVLEERVFKEGDFKDGEKLIHREGLVILVALRFKFMYLPVTECLCLLFCWVNVFVCTSRSFSEVTPPPPNNRASARYLRL